MALPREYEQRYEKLQNDLLELQKSIQELSETAYAPDRTVAATVGARGELRDLVLDPRIYRSTDAKALAATIKQTIWDASSAVSARLIELTRPMLPTDGSGDGIDLEAALGNLAPVDGVSG
ncbi:MAG TPA: YbaB/EbfC family nucleoid-associated protein [Jatrophihabitantaceae bacterium]|jgi:DNA-binding protein YbaB